MSKVLVVGDLHAQVSNLEETRILFDFILSQATTNQCSYVFFLGDIFHTHSVVRQEVAFLVKNFLLELKKRNIISIVVVGNHDSASPKATDINAVNLILSDCSIVVDSHEGYFLPLNEKFECFFLPYIHKPKEFEIAAKKIKECYSSNKLCTKLLFCHQPFAGAVYENGAVCMESDLSADTIDYDAIISGHIHKSQFLEKVFYVGTPRPITWGEVNQHKFIYVFDMHDVFKYTPISTVGIVPHYYSITLQEEDLKNYEKVIRDWCVKCNHFYKIDKVKINVYTSDVDTVKAVRSLASELINGSVYIKHFPITEMQSGKASLESLSWAEQISRYIDLNPMIPAAIKSDVKSVALKAWEEGGI